MSPVEVRQIGHVASAPVVETFSLGGRTENKALITVISNTRWKDRDGNVRSKATAVELHPNLTRELHQILTHPG